MFHEFNTNNFVLNNTLQLFTLCLGIEKVLISIDVLKKKQKTKVR